LHNITGTIALSANLAESSEALFTARIPKEWLKKSWEAATLGNWFLGLLQRHDQLSKWLHVGRPKAYWLTGFFNPQASQFLERSAWRGGGAQISCSGNLEFRSRVQAGCF